jgi:hypothetical protein
VKEVHCKNKACDQVIGSSDGRTFFDGFKPVDELRCRRCSTVRKFNGKRVTPAAMIFNDFNLQIKLT